VTARGQHAAGLELRGRQNAAGRRGPVVRMQSSRDDPDARMPGWPEARMGGSVCEIAGLWVASPGYMPASLFLWERQDAAWQCR
jgi:hypothetical protein